MVLAMVPLATTAAPASACLNAVAGELVKDLKVVKQAEKHLSSGKLLLAAINLQTTVPGVRERRPVHGGNFDSPLVAWELTEASVRIMAMVTVRTGGAWLYRKNGTHVLAVPSEEARVENLEWAVESLRLGWLPRPPSSDLAFADPQPVKPSPPPGKAVVPENPRDASNLGEALSLLPAHQAEARTILEDLAAKDVITSASAYAALARLRTAASDEAGAKAALQQCAALGGKRAHFVCVPGEPRPRVDPTVGESAPRSAARS
jgi:hypothetical protein